MTENETNLAPEPQAGIQGKPVKKRPEIVSFLIAAGIVLLILVLFAAGFAAYSYFARADILGALPAGFSAYVRTDSFAGSVEPLLSLEAADVFLSDPAFAAAREMLVALRSNDLLQSPAFRFAASRRIDAAFYDNSEFVVLVDMGPFAALGRVSAVASWFVDIPSLAYVNSGKNSRYEYRMENGYIYAKSCKNLVVITNSENMLRRAVSLENAADYEPSVAALLSEPLREPFRFIIRPDTVLAQIASDDPVVSSLLERISFTGYSSVSFHVSEKDISVKAVVPVSSADETLAAVIARPSGVPSLLPLLPDNTQYYTLVSAGSLEELKDACLPSFPDSAGIEALWQNADRLSRAAFSLSLDELLFSWTGNEFAVIGLEGKPDPVFAVKVSDPRNRERIFSAVLSSVVVREDDGLFVNGVRLPQLMLPSFLQRLLNAFGFKIPKPYYLVENGYIFFSESAENLANLSASVKSGGRLVKEDSWVSFSGGQSPESAVSIFYNLKRSVPFFLRSQSPVSQVIRLYEQGRADVSFSGDSLVFQLQASIPPDSSGSAVPGFPVKAEGTVSPVIYGGGSAASPRLFWLEDSVRVVSYNPVNGVRVSAELDAPGWIVKGSGESDMLWAVSRTGSVWLFDGDLKTTAGFPLLTGESTASVPVVQTDAVVMPLENGVLCRVDRQGVVSYIRIPHSGELKSPPAVSGSAMSVYSKSFFGEIFLVESGLPAGGFWPVDVDGIAFGSPALLAEGAQLFTGFVTQAGVFYVWSRDGSPVEGFPVKLDGVFYLNAAAGDSCFWLLSSAGTLYRVDLAGNVLSVSIPNLSAESGYITVADYDGDGESEVFVSGDANVLYGFKNNLELIRDFPFVAWGVPVFLDVNGDRKPECIAPSLNNTFSAWKLR